MPEGVAQAQVAVVQMDVAALLQCGFAVSRALEPATDDLGAIEAIKRAFLIQYEILKAFHVLVSLVSV